jgi:hypothetical protein
MKLDALHARVLHTAVDGTQFRRLLLDEAVVEFDDVRIELPASDVASTRQALLELLQLGYVFLERYDEATQTFVALSDEEACAAAAAPENWEPPFDPNLGVEIRHPAGTDALGEALVGLAGRR